MSGFDDAPQPASADPAAAPELVVDLAAFLPEGVAVGDEADVEPAGADGDAAGDEPREQLAPEPAAAASTSGVDLDALRQIELDLDAVDAAIAALDAGTYGIDPETGERIDDDLLAADPTRLS